ncbi:MAG TPA: 2-C-methyl-D-erythritol 2,4-cyclodiphosphate synthase, partial [Thermoanaerobaculia bacterium]|nr:2-C-methyl-D-erythritol 2,4-cyclodiphosphate synthase [Thermoanaerobaculia bacterium]
MRVGIGFDAHPFAEGRPLRLGGVDIPHTSGLRGHSDGDALLHAITDAILGAAGLGSIGDRFPDTDPAWKGADSSVFVERARDLMADRGLDVGHLDALVIAESPRIAPHA